MQQVYNIMVGNNRNKQIRDEDFEENGANIVEQERPLNAHEFLVTAPPDEVTYTTLIRYLRRSTDALVNEQRAKLGAKSPEVTDKQGLEKQCKVNMKKGEKIMRMMREDCLLINFPTYASMIFLCLSAKQVGKADLLFEEMKMVGYEPDDNIYEAVIKAFCAVGNVDYASKLFDEMKKMKWEPHSSVAAALSKAQTKNGNNKV